MGGERKVCKVRWESEKERDHFEDQRSRWDEGIRMDLREIGWRCGLDSTGSG
jgi:hypothetical protein